MTVDPITIAMGLATFAPQIVRWVGGSDQAAEAAQRVVEVAQAVTGKPAAEALAALQADPSLVLQFRQALAGIEAELDKAYLVDRQHARTTHASHWMPAALTVGLGAMVTLMVAGLFAWPTPPENKEVIYLIAGQIIGSFSAAVAYWIGSSRSSAMKQEDMVSLLRK